MGFLVYVKNMFYICKIIFKRNCMKLADMDLQELVGNEFIDHMTYNGSSIKKRFYKIINEMEPITYKDKGSEVIKPTTLRKGDVVRLHQGTKRRPCVVIKVKKDFVVVIPLTSTDNIHTTETKFKSRFFGEGYFSKTLNIATIEYALDNFEGILEDTTNLGKAMREVKEFYNKLI